MSVTRKILECPIEGAASIGVTSVRIYIFQLASCGVFHTGWSRGDGQEPRYVGRYAVEHNATQETVLQVRVWFRDRGLAGVKVRKPAEIGGDIPETIMEAAQR